MLRLRAGGRRAACCGSQLGSGGQADGPGYGAGDGGHLVRRACTVAERQHRRRPHALFASETQQSAEPPPPQGRSTPLTLHSHLVSKARPCLPYLSAHVAPTSRWGDKEYPDSVVLGIGKNVPSKFYGVTSGLALGIGLYCIAQSNLLNILSGSSVNGFYVFGSLLVPYSWGLHVASWIQKQNGK